MSACRQLLTLKGRREEEREESRVRKGGRERERKGGRERGREEGREREIT